MTHAWCHDIPRDEAVRSSEDGRSGPLPTLEAVIAQPFRNDTCQMCHGAGFVAERGTRGRFICDLCHGNGRAMIPKSVSASSALEQENKGNDMSGSTLFPVSEQPAPAPPFAEPAKCSSAVSETGEGQSGLRTERVTERRPVDAGGGGNVTGGLRTERVTLEVTHDGTWGHPSSWPWFNSSFLAWVRSRRGELVRVVEEAHFDDLAQVAMERDAAIRERDELRAERITQALTADRFAAAVAEADTLRARVAELESAAKLAPAANADGGSNHAAPAASGAAGPEANG